MDRLDEKILSELQSDASLAVSEIADRVGLTTTPCWRRIQRLEELGVIKKRVALLDRDKLDLGIDVFVSVRTREHDEEWLQDFAREVAVFEEVVEFYRMSGDVDYLLRIVVKDIAAYDLFYKKLIKKVKLSDVSSSFAMERLKYTTELPLDARR